MSAIVDACPVTSKNEGPLDASTAGSCLPDPHSLIEDTDWSSLQHAYGPAQDTPSRLLELLHDDSEIRAAALEQLDITVLHQGSLYTATAPAALFVAAILDDSRTLVLQESVFPWEDSSRPLRAALIDWLGTAADSAAHGEAEDDPDEVTPAPANAVRRIRVVLYEAVSAHLQAPDPDIRGAALETVAALFEAPELSDRLDEAGQLLRPVLTGRSERRERAVITVTLGAWGQDTSSLLTDPDPAVRACAALAPACAEDSRATREILRALCHPEAVDAWFDEPLPYIDGSLRRALLSSAIERTGSFEELLPAALASIPRSSNLTAADDWGPLLTAVFPLGYSEGTKLGTAQRRYLRALVNRDEVWRFTHLTAHWFQNVGLPADRAFIRTLLQQLP